MRVKQHYNCISGENYSFDHLVLAGGALGYEAQGAKGFFVPFGLKQRPVVGDAIYLAGDAAGGRFFGPAFSWLLDHFILNKTGSLHD